MTDFFICDKDSFLGAHHLFASAHYVDLPNGQIVVSAEFFSENHRALWQTSGALCFPHPLSSEKVGNDIASALSAFSVSASDGSFDAAKKLSAAHPLMRYR
ncbi:MAG TPA: hypothetical protein VFI60_05680 [Candidatus Acidoferrum sp.]|nr:hypothetical protein [Candidatus Acidoferrum sp.]